MKQPLPIALFAGGLVLLAFYKSMGGIDGIRSHPGEALIVALIAAIAMAMSFLSRRHRMSQNSPYFAVPDPAPGTPPDARLTSLPLVLIASRGKMLGTLAIALLGAPFVALMLASQPGICGTVGLASFAPILLGGLAMLAVGLVWPERLEIAPWGLKHVTFWRTREWPWAEVRDVMIIRTLGGAWTSGIVFNRHASPTSQPGSVRPSLRAVWPLPTDEVAALINEARVRWSPAGADLAPAHRRITDYLPLALTWGMAAALAVLIVLRPCG